MEAPRSRGSQRWMPDSRSPRPATPLDRRCGSGLQAVLNAAMQVQTGVSDVVIAGGVDSMSQAPFYRTDGRFDPDGDGDLGASAARCARPRPRDGRRQVPPHARRHDRDRREPAPRVRHLAGGPGRVRAAVPPARGRRAGVRGVRRGDRRDPRDRRGTSIHAPTPPSRRSPAQADPAREGRRVDRDRGQRRGPERRGGRVHRDDARARGGARTHAARAARVVGRRRCRARADGRRTGARRPSARCRVRA